MRECPVFLNKQRVQISQQSFAKFSLSCVRTCMCICVWQYVCVYVVVCACKCVLKSVGQFTIYFEATFPFLQIRLEFYFYN